MKPSRLPVRRLLHARASTAGKRCEGRSTSVVAALLEVTPLLAVIALLAVAALPAAAQAPAPQAPPCDAADPQWVCGQRTPEDLVALPGDRWVLASAYSGAGGINLIEVATRRSSTVFPSAAVKIEPDRSTYPACPGPPAAGFMTHGLYLEQGDGPVLRFMAVVHGPRESIDVFKVDTRPQPPALTWVGCVIAPEPIGLNSVRGLADGGFITTNWLPRGASQDALRKMMAGEKNGELWEWHRLGGWRKVPGSQAAGANGIELSADGKTLYMAAWGSQSFVRLTRGATPPKRDEIPLGFRVDNVHFARDGSLLAAGQDTGVNPPTSHVVKIDPQSLAVRPLVNRPGNAEFAGSTAAIEVGDKLWLGAYRGDRIAIVPAP